MAWQDDNKAIVFLSLFFIELFGRLGFRGIVFYDMSYIMSASISDRAKYWKTHSMIHIPIWRKERHMKKHSTIHSPMWRKERQIQEREDVMLHRESFQIIFRSNRVRAQI